MSSSDRTKSPVIEHRQGLRHATFGPLARPDAALVRSSADDPRVRGESVRKLGWGAMKSQVTEWASAFCKSVGVCLRRFESCTCHRVEKGL